MKKLLLFALISTVIIGCTTTSENNFIVQGKIVGLKKGTLYLEKFVGDTITAIDSIYIDDATETFQFKNHISEPEIFLLSLDRLQKKQISFLGEAGTTNIHTYLNQFFVKAKITGSNLQELLEKHDAHTAKLNANNLDLIKEKFEAQKQGDSILIEEIELKKLKNLKRTYLFSANYAIAHKDKAIAPFIAVYRMDRATPTLKQKIYDALTPKIKNSKYGLLLKSALN